MWCLENLLLKTEMFVFFIFKESFRTKAESKILNDKGMHKYLKYFTKISVYNYDTKKHFAKRLENLSTKIYVVGCPRGTIQL